MSLSIPITRSPSRANRLTVSEPINPAEPVTITERMQPAVGYNYLPQSSSLSPFSGNTWQAPPKTLFMSSRA
jgi:hypothetical protein